MAQLNSRERIAAQMRVNQRVIDNPQTIHQWKLFRKRNAELEALLEKYTCEVCEEACVPQDGVSLCPSCLEEFDRLHDMDKWERITLNGHEQAFLISLLAEKDVIALLFSSENYPAETRESLERKLYDF